MFLRHFIASELLINGAEPGQSQLTYQIHFKEHALVIAAESVL